MADTRLSERRADPSQSAVSQSTGLREQQLRQALGNYDADRYWHDTAASYSYYPTVRHRSRFILGVLRQLGPMNDTVVFDYGCGDGTLLGRIRDTFGLRYDQMAGCDLSNTAVDLAMQKLGSSHIHNQPCPAIKQRFTTIICSEVIEHTTEHEETLQWIADHLVPGGITILTTQGGRVHACDRYTGHTQHFRTASLISWIEGLGLKVIYARKWGFPLFWLQKYLTNFRFRAVRENYLDGPLTLRKRLVFRMAYALYFMHDLIPLGPQIYLVARRPSQSRALTAGKHHKPH